MKETDNEARLTIVLICTQLSGSVNEAKESNKNECQASVHTYFYGIHRVHMYPDSLGSTQCYNSYQTVIIIMWLHLVHKHDT